MRPQGEGTRDNTISEAGGEAFYLSFSAVEHAPPICRLRSITVLEPPAEASTMAAERPLGPEPMMVAVVIERSKTSDWRFGIYGSQALT